MTSIATVWNPSSSRLRSAFRSPTINVFSVRAHLWMRNPPVRSLCVAQIGEHNNNLVEAPGLRNTWTVIESIVNSFPGWSCSTDAISFCSRENWKRLIGALGAAVASLAVLFGISLSSTALQDSNNRLQITKDAQELTTQPMRCTTGSLHEFHRHTFLALQNLKVIDVDARPDDVCTRREYARWLVSATHIFARSSASKLYPAMFIENVTELAFDDVTPNDPDFSVIQGLAEAGFIPSRLLRNNGPPCFLPESPLSRLDMVMWKIVVEKWPHVGEGKASCHFMDVDTIERDAGPALLSDLSSGRDLIVSLAFGYTKLLQPNKPVTKAQAAVAIATGEESTDAVASERDRVRAEETRRREFETAQRESQRRRLEDQRRAVSVARACVEESHRRVTEQARAVEEARDWWVSRGLTVVVDPELETATADDRDDDDEKLRFSAGQGTNEGEGAIGVAAAAAVKGDGGFVGEILGRVKSLLDKFKM